MVCVVSGMRGPSYSLWRSVPAIFIHGNMPNRHLEDQRKLPAKMHLDGLHGGFGRTHGSAGPTLPPLPTVLLWYTAWWALVLMCRCRGFVGRFGLSGGSILHVFDLLRLYLRILCVFFLFRTCAPENINLRKQLWS